MPDAPDPVPGPERQSDARLKRDAALRRVGRTRRWVIGSSAALTAGFAVLVAEVAPGHSAAASNAKSSSAVSQPAMPAVASPGELGLSAPSQAPQSAPQPQPAPAPPSDSSQNDAPVSGGS
jgi:hypothetical protein